MIAEWSLGERTVDAVLVGIPFPRPVIAQVDGVYRPSVDSALLCRHTVRELTADSSPRSVVELCAGSGIASIYAAFAGASVRAVDDRGSAVKAVRSNAEANGVTVEAVEADVRDWTPDEPADLVIANPPYVPAPSASADGHAWDAGPDGRDVLDAIVDRAPELLAPDGVLLLVFSEIAGVRAVLERLERRGLVGDVVDDAVLEFGPVMMQRADWLADRGVISRDQRVERLVVVRAARASQGAWSTSR